MKKASQFLNVFATEYVEIITDIKQITSVNVSEEQVTPVEVPVTITGFVMDADEIFTYLSIDGENVNQAIPTASIRHIAIIDVSKELDKVIDDITLPEDDGSYH